MFNMSEVEWLILGFYDDFFTQLSHGNDNINHTFK